LLPSAGDKQPVPITIRVLTPQQRAVKIKKEDGVCSFPGFSSHINSSLSSDPVSEMGFHSSFSSLSGGVAYSLTIESLFVMLLK
jgi:hypothetical protein